MRLNRHSVYRRRPRHQPNRHRCNVNRTAHRAHRRRSAKWLRAGLKRPTARHGWRDGRAGRRLARRGVRAGGVALRSETRGHDACASFSQIARHRTGGPGHADYRGHSRQGRRFVNGHWRGPPWLICGWLRLRPRAVPTEPAEPGRRWFGLPPQDEVGVEGVVVGLVDEVGFAGALMPQSGEEPGQSLTDVGVVVVVVVGFGQFEAHGCNRLA